MKLNMVLAQINGQGIRSFIGCHDLAVEFADWLQSKGHEVLIVPDMEPAEQPRTQGEEDISMTLCNQFNRERPLGR